MSERTTDTSASLLLRIRDPNDRDAWATFVDVYAPLIRRYCQRKGLQSSDAADVSQELMLRVSRAISSFEYSRELGRFRNWLGRITANEIASNWTRTGRLPVDTDRITSDLKQGDPDWNQEYTDHILSLAVDRIRGEFAGDTWAAFEATWIRHESPVAVASKLGIAIHVVYVNKSRVLKRLKTEVMALAEDIPAIQKP